MSEGFNIETEDKVYWISLEELEKAVVTYFSKDLIKAKGMIENKTIYRVETKDIIGVVNIDVIANSLDEALRIFKELRESKEAPEAPIISVRQWSEAWMETEKC